MSKLSFRLMREEDLGGADRLRALVGWNQTLSDWRRLLHMEPQGCFVAAIDAEVVGTVTTTSYGRELAWIGMMLVHPEHRRQGIGRSLMLRALGYLRDRRSECIRLDATPAGQPLYEQLGFTTEWTLTRWQRVAGIALDIENSSQTDARPLESKDWAAVEALDSNAFGVRRSELLHSLAMDSRYGLVWPAEREVLGWGLLRPGANADYLGPLASTSMEGAFCLAASLIRNAEGRSVYWDIPDQNNFAKAAAEKLGFGPVRPLTRMQFGSKSAGRSANISFGIADPAVG